MKKPPLRRPAPRARPAEARPVEGLRALLRAIDRAPYDQYRRLLGRHDLGEFELVVDRVPPEPFAGPARIRLLVDRSKAALPASFAATASRRLGVEDCLARAAATAVGQWSLAGPNAPPGTGQILVEPCGTAMIERSTCRIRERVIELRLLADLPAAGRTIRGQQAEELFFTKLAGIAASTLLFSARRVEEARASADAAEDHEALSTELARRGLIAFVADGSVLVEPSESGSVPFVSPEGLAQTIRLPRAGTIRGMGIPAGVTVVVGGAFHGKSTLLEALANGVHPHPPGDGRERVASLAGTVAIRAERSRSVRHVDLSPFLGELPSGIRSADYSSDDAGGSTAEAASIVEALESGARVLLFDEDTSASNLMVRDGRMQRLVPRPAEPIVPLIDRLRELYERFGVSTVLATGGSGDYVEVADTVVQMDTFRASDATARAREIAKSTSSMRLREILPAFEPTPPRHPHVDPGVVPEKLRVGLRGATSLVMGEDQIDLSALAQIVEAGQVRALGKILVACAVRMAPGKDLAALLDEIGELLDREGLDCLDPPGFSDLSRPRRHEIAAALNRWKLLRIRRADR